MEIGSATSRFFKVNVLIQSLRALLYPRSGRFKFEARRLESTNIRKTFVS